MDVNCYLTFVDVLGVVIDHDSIWLPELSKEGLRHQHLLNREAPRDANHIEELLTDYAEGHQALHFALFLWRKILKLATSASLPVEASAARHDCLPTA